MFSQLMMVALNPNLTAKQLEDVSQQIIQGKQACFEKAKECLGSLPTLEMRTAYLQAILPLLVM